MARNRHADLSLPSSLFSRLLTQLGLHLYNSVAYLTARAMTPIATEIVPEMRNLWSKFG
jgi:hypothetical protein